VKKGNMRATWQSRNFLLYKDATLGIASADCYQKPFHRHRNDNCKFYFLCANPMSDEKLDRIIELLEKIEKQSAPPPFWRTLLAWVFQHFFTLLALAVLAYVTWEIWGVVNALSETVENATESFGEYTDSVSSFTENALQNVKDFSITDIFD
jgi:hypothetical protein